MKVMLIDDERLAIMQLEMMLNQSYSEVIKDIRTFQLVSEAIEDIPSYKPNVVFLDIHMPEMSGMEAAEKIQALHPNVEIIFVTAYDQFAIQAFELNALDYLLKPVTHARLDKTIQRIIETVKVPTTVEPVPFIQKIYCMNKIRFQLCGQPQVYPKWRTAKAQELFAYLIHHRGEYVSKYKIINMFTPEIDKKRGLTQLYTVVYQIRRCLKESGIDLVIENDSIQESYCLKVENTLFDFEEWEQQARQLSQHEPLDYEQLETIVSSYEGNYMGEYDYPWADSERERLLQLWISHANQLVAHYLATSHWMKVISLTEKLFYFNPYDYEQVLPLLQAYAGLGQIDKVKLYFDKYEKECLAELDLPLPEETTEWYETWLTVNMV